MTRCEYCGASVTGSVCEYCEMPVKNIPAPPKIIYKPRNTIIKNKGKFRRTILACVLTVVAANIIGMAVMVNSGHHNYSYIPVERVGDHNNEYAIEYNYDGYNIEEAIPVYDEERPVYDQNEAFRENGVFPSGTYQIGVDMPEGLYIFIPEFSDNHGVQGVYSDPECQNQISSAYVHFDGTRIAEISGNGYVEFSWATAYNLDMHPEIMNDPYESDGMFIVGRDIEAGTYILEETGDMSEYAEWYIYSGINSVGTVLKESGQLYSYGDYMENITNEITLNDGEFLELHNCHIVR
ncbi:MAG: hypothetical protein K2J40_06660 [Ruminococcus sp.]|nr:hypothetical protein [Ruminococcus sp.]